MKKISFCAVLLMAFALPFIAAQEDTSGNAVDAPDGASAELSQEIAPAEEHTAAAVIDDLQDARRRISLSVLEEAESSALRSLTASRTNEMGFPLRLGIALGIIAAQALLIWVVWQLFKHLTKKVEKNGIAKIKPLTIRKLRLLTTRQIVYAIAVLLRILKYLVTAFQFFLTVPIVFSLFPATRNLANTLFGYILDPIKNIAIGVVTHIPNLITIVIIVTVTRYVIKGLKFFSIQIARGKLVIPGFYEDWAEPTYKILQVLLWAFTVAVVYPYLPGSDSRIFQGVSVFVGIIFSLGSSSAIGNLVAGIVITYMRPFKTGDRVKINDSTGFVVEKNLMVVRLKTHKNEYVTFPNLIILNSGIINYNTSSDEDEEGLILNTEVTVGYATPWKTIHELLINAALATDHILKRPKPFVLQTSLDDFYARYQINCYTKDVDLVPAIYAELYENIQNSFRGAGLDLTSPHFETTRVENSFTE